MLLISCLRRRLKRRIQISASVLTRKAWKHVLNFHEVPQPEACDVCRYAQEQQLDCAYEHARARVATSFMIQDLSDLNGRTASLGSLAVASVGVEPGPVHPIEPRHWFWAMFFAPEIRIGLRERVEHG